MIDFLDDDANDCESVGAHLKNVIRVFMMVARAGQIARRPEGVLVCGRGVISVTLVSHPPIGRGVRDFCAQMLCSHSGLYSPARAAANRVAALWSSFFPCPLQLLAAKRIWPAILIDSKFPTKLHGTGLSPIFLRLKRKIPFEAAAAAPELQQECE